MNVDNCDIFVTIDGLSDRECVDNIVISNCTVSGISVRQKLTGLVKGYKLKNIKYGK